jgi:hypothetical protein
MGFDVLAAVKIEPVVFWVDMFYSQYGGSRLLRNGGVMT